MNELYELIDELIDEEECRFDHNGNCQVHYYFGEPGECVHQKAKKILEQRQESGHVETIVIGDSWISTDDRLPENGQNVLVFPDYVICMYGTEDFGGDILGLENEFSYFSEYNDEDRKPDFPVTHWKPLPKPPLATHQTIEKESK